MECLTRRPASPLLAPFVEVLWSWEAPQAAHRMERLLPDGSVAIVINLRENCSRVFDRETLERANSLPGAIVTGAHSRYFVIDTEESLSVAGIHFKPGGAFPFLGLPAGELIDQHVPLEALWGSAAEEMRERLLASPSAAERLRVMEESLLARARGPLVPHPAVKYALAEFRRRQRSVGDVTGQIGLSSRQFIAVFRDQVGLTPKLYCRVERFQAVLRRIRSGTPFDWADLAIDCGYFDQPHFIHDFRDFSGISPTAYAREDLRNNNHVPIRD